MWMKLLQEAVQQSGKGGKAEVARKLGLSRPAISQIMNGKYAAKTDRIAKKIMEIFGRINCPHLGVDITHEQCRLNHDRAAPTSSPREMKHWRACQTCNRNPKRNDNKE